MDFERIFPVDLDRRSSSREIMISRGNELSKQRENKLLLFITIIIFLQAKNKIVREESKIVCETNQTHK